MFGAIGKIFGGASEAPYISDLLRWLGRVQEGALKRWLPVALQNIACSDANQRQGPCHQIAVAVCELCRRPTCLDHALVGATAEVVCLRCFYVLRTGQGQAQNGNGHAQAQTNGQNGHAAVDPKELLKKHFKVLRLRSTATVVQLKERYKELMLKNHPDRGGSEEKAKEINVAYEWLLKNHFQS